MSQELTPYDTGEKCEPKVWQILGERERYGRVDFDTDEDYTVATLWIERKEDGGYVLKGYNNEPLEVDLTDQTGENPWALTRTQPDAYEDWKLQAQNGETLLGFKEWIENGARDG